MRYSIAKANVQDHTISILIPSASSNYERPKFSPNGKFLAFVEYSLDPTTTLSGQLKIYDFEKRVVTKTLNDTYPLSSPSWSHDSKQLLFVTSKMQVTLFHLTTDRSETLPVSARSAIWGTDGRIYFLENKNVPMTIFSISTADKDKSVFYKLTSNRNTQMGASSSIEELSGFSPDGRYFLMTTLTQIAGARSRTLEVLDVNEKLVYTLHKGNIIGANWCYK
jgi:Tol biopolymer transport system component